MNASKIIHLDRIYHGARRETLLVCAQSDPVRVSREAPLMNGIEKFGSPDALE